MRQAITIGCGIILFFILSGCTDHSRNFTVYVEDTSSFEIGSIEAAVDKQGDETSTATPEISPTISIPAI